MKPVVSRRARRAALALVLTACPQPGAQDSDTDPQTSTEGTSDGGESSATTTTAGTTGPLPGETSDGPTSTTTSTTTTSDAVTTTGDTTTGDTTTGDATTGGATTGGEPKTCRKVDILLVIDNDSNLGTAVYEVEDMAAHLAGRLQGDLADWSYHVMAIDTDAFWGNEFCEERCALYGSCEDLIPGYPCAYSPNECDSTRGAGIVFPAGGWAANKWCKLAGGKRYFDNNQPDIAATLDCITRPGFATKSPHMLIGSTLEALSAPLNNGCNAGFLRDDAFLILVLINTIADKHTPGTPKEWHQQVLASKGGNFDKVFTIGFINDGFWGIVCGAFEDGGDTKPLMDFVKLFFRKSLGSLCEESYAPRLDAAFKYINEACPA